MKSVRVQRRAIGTLADGRHGWPKGTNRMEATWALLVEDDEDVAVAMSECLRREGLQVQWAGSGPAAVSILDAHDWAVVILDIELPGMNGFEVLRRIRAANIEAEVVFLTGRNTDIDEIVGFRVGADDYIRKPMTSFEVVAARISRSVIRYRDRKRPQPGHVIAAAADPSAPELLRFGDMVLDQNQRNLYRNGSAIELTRTEFDLLWTMASEPDRVFKRDQLLRLVWGIDGGIGSTVTVDTHIHRLRNKVEADPGNPQCILTVHGVGYKFRRVPNR